jgi:N-sulfoglucosamine sulfohydrolase
MFRCFLLMVALLAVSCQPAAAAERNVVLIVADDQSPDMGCYGNPVLKTPNMDALAAAGTRFTHAFCTTASCSASRSVILSGLFNHATGQYGHEHHFHHFRSYESMQTLPVLLGKLGYRTARCGKYHVGPEEVYQFDKALPGNSRHPVQMAEHCREFVSAESDAPFFLYFCTSDPHRGGGFAKELEHGPDRFGNLPQGKSRGGLKPVLYDPGAVIVPPFLPDTPVCRAELAQYYQSISRIDQGLGRLWEILKAAGHWDDTLVIYTSDHGIAFPGGKTTLYEGGMQVPLLVKPPGAGKPGVVSSAMVSLVDLTPTILDFAGGLADDGSVKPTLAKAIIRQGAIGGAKNLNRHHGRSFLTAIGKEKAEGFDEVFASHTFHEIQMYYPMRVVRGRRYKLIWNIAHPLPFPFASDLWAAPTWQDRYQRGPDTLYGKRTVDRYIHRPKFELFDLEADPDETRNLADSSEHAEILKQLQGKLKQFQKETWDGWVLKWDYE